MAKLTWDAVSAPNFGNPVDGIRTAAELFGRATASAKAGIDQFVAQRNQAAERAILQRALAVSDPTQLAKMQADGSLLGSEGQYASADLLDKLADRQTDLVTLAGKNQDLAVSRYTQNRLENQNKLSDAARPVAAAALAAISRGDNDEYQNIISSSPELAQMDIKQLTDLVQSGTSIRSTLNQMDNDNTRVGYEGDRVELDRKRTESQIATNELQRKVSKYNLDRSEIEDGREDKTYTAKQDAAKWFFQDLPEMYDDVSASKQFTEFARLSNDPEAMAEYLRLNTNAGYNPVKPVDVGALGAGDVSDATRTSLSQIKSLAARVADGNNSREVPYSQADMEADAADGRAAIEIANTLVGEGKPFPDSTALQLSKDINALAVSNNIKPAQAARILLNSALPAFWSDYKFDEEVVNNLAKRTSTGELLAAAAANDAATSTVKSIQGMSDKLVQLESRLSGIQKINSPLGRDGKLDADEAQLKEQIEKLRERLNEAVGAAQKDTRLFRQN